MTVTLDHPIYTPDDPTTARALINSESWLTTDGANHSLRMVAVDDMTPEHQARLLAWLRANAQTMVEHVERSIERAYRTHHLGWDERHALLDDLLAQPAAVWIEDTRLVRRLVQLVPREPARPARRRWWKR